LLTEAVVKAGTAKREAVLILGTLVAASFKKYLPVIALFAIPVNPEVNWYRNVESLAEFRKMQ
jgi:hypothetical protein